MTAVTQNNIGGLNYEQSEQESTESAESEFLPEPSEPKSAEPE